MTQPVALDYQTPALPEAPPRNPGRYLFVDALRGVAAVLVVMHHLLHNTVMDVTLTAALPRWYLFVSEYGRCGVEIFFVLSGFVIAHSIRSIVPDAAGAWNFIVRRQVRLDPPYWAMIAVTLVDTAVENHVPGLVHKPIVGPVGVLLNLFYLQNVTGAGQVVGVAWTLCLEIQFYLLFMTATAVGYALSPTRQNPSRLAVWLVVLSGVACLAAARQQFVFVAWFFSFWPYFVIGATCYWATHGRMPGWAFGLYAAVFGVVLYRFGPDDHSFVLVGLATALSLYAAAKWDKMRTWGRGAVLQHLGRLSYSLYLVHLTVLGIVLRGGYKLTHENRWAALGWYVVAAAAAVAAAELFHRAFEVPSMRWATKLKRRRITTAEVAAGLPPIPAVVPT